MNGSLTLAALATFGVAAAGVAGGLWLGGTIRSDLRRLSMVAAGALLLVCLVDLMPEAKADLPWSWFFAALAAGAIAAWLISHRFTVKAPCCEPGEGLLAVDNRALLVAIGLHCFLDGVGLAVSGLMAKHADWLFTGTLCLHKLPEGFALAALMLGSGLVVGRALAASLALEALTLVGVGAGFFVSRWLAAPPLAVGTALLAGIFLFLSVTVLWSAVAGNRQVGVGKV